MRINLKQPVLDYEGKPITNPNPDTGKEEELTLFQVFVNALNGRIPNETLTAEMKAKIYQISKKIYDSKEPNFTPDQLIIIKDRVGKSYAPVVYGKVLEIIDGTDEPKQEEAKTAEAPENPSAN